MVETKIRAFDAAAQQRLMVLKFSVNPSRGPRTTVSLCGSVTPRV
jgi:hypothetical protein